MHHYSKDAQGEWIYGQSKQVLTTGDKLLMSIGVAGGFIMILQEMVKVAFS